jgi:hypothetical protein
MPTSSAPDFRARILALRGQAPDLPEPVRDCGGKWFEPFAWFDLASRSWKTWQRCLVEGWEPFSETWPRSGMMRNGIAYRRAPLAPLTDEIASGLLPTPEASNTKAVALRSAGRSPRNFLAPLPTPRASDGNKGTRTAEGAAREVARNRGPDLGAVAGGPLNPTWIEWLQGFPLEWTDLGASETP